MLTLYQTTGDDDTHEVPLEWKDMPFVPGDAWNLIFTAKRRKSDADPRALIQKDSGRGIKVQGTTAMVTLARADTAALRAMTLHCDIQASHRTLGTVRTVAGPFRLELRQDVTRLAEVSIPIYVPPDSAYVTMAQNRRTGGWASIYLDNIGGRLTLQSEVVFPTTAPPPAIIKNRRLNRYETLYIDQVAGDGSDTVQTEIFGAALPEYPTASLVINRQTGQASKLFIDQVDGDGSDTLQTEILTP